MSVSFRVFADISFVGSTLSGQEDAGDITVLVDLQGIDFNSRFNPIDQVQFDYSISGGTATAGVDYISASGTLTWTALGSQPINISIISDSVAEPDETFSVTLTNCQALAEVNPCDQVLSLSLGPTNVTIINDDFPGTLSLNSSSASATEGSVTTFSVTRTGGSSGSVSVDYTTANGSAIAGNDYTSSSGTLTWADGDSVSKTFTVSALADVVVDADETFTVNLSNVSGGASLGISSTVTTISDATAPGTLNLDSSTVSVEEGGVATFLVTRTGGGDGGVSVDYTTVNGSAIEGSDYTGSSGTLTWADGETTSKTITVNTLTDLVVDENEMFTLILVNVQGNAPLGSISTATITIDNTTLLLKDLKALTPEQKKVASSVDELCTNTTGELLQACQVIYEAGLTDAQLIEAIDSITPSQVASQGTVAVDFGFQQLNVIHGRIATLRSNKGSKNRMSLAGLSINAYGKSIPVGQISQNLLTEAMMGASSDDVFRDSPLGFFIKGQINIGDKKSSDKEKGFNVILESITVGLDYQFTDQLLMGVGTGYGYSDTEYNGGSGEMETHSGNISLYGSYYLPKDFYLDWVLNYSINAYDSKRNISFIGFQGAANSDLFSNQYGGSLGFGKDFYIRDFFISPYARVEYLFTSIDDYQESGGGGLALQLEEQSIHSATATLGGQISQSISMPWGIISPGVRFEWMHEFEDDEREIKSRFVNAPSGNGGFSLGTDAPDRDYFNLGASVAITLPEGKSAFLRYETRLGQNDISSHTIEASFRIPF